MLRSQAVVDVAVPCACTNRPLWARLEDETVWIEQYRQLWDARFVELDKVVEELKRKEKVDGRKKRD